MLSFENCDRLKYGLNGIALPGDLFSSVKKLLQSSLVKTAVGGPCMETLRMLTPPLEATNVENEEIAVFERYGTDWLIEAVWGLIGWDLMA